MFELFQFLGIGNEFSNYVCALTTELDSVKEKIRNLSKDDYDDLHNKIKELKKEDYTSVIVLSPNLEGKGTVRLSGFDTSNVHFLKI